MSGSQSLAKRAPHPERDAWMRTVLGIEVASAAGVAPGAAPKPPAPPGTPAQPTAVGKPGLNYVTQIVGGGSVPIPGQPVGVGGGVGVGRGRNKGKEQYFLVGRITTSGVPKASDAVSAEFIGSMSPIMGRSVPTRTATITSPPLREDAGPTLGGATTKNQLGVTASHFSNFPLDPADRINVGFGGFTNTATISFPGPGNTALGVTGTLQAVNNTRGRTPTDADAVKQVADGTAAIKQPGKRPIPAVDKNAPVIFSTSASLSTVNKPGVKPVVAAQGAVTFTVPISKKNTPKWIQDLLQRIEAAQRSPDPTVLMQLLRDIESSPQLKKRLLDWELKEFERVSAPHPSGAPAPRPVGAPDPGWAVEVGEALRNAAANWRPPTPAQTAELTLAAALAALGAFVAANPEIWLLLAL